MVLKNIYKRVQDRIQTKIAPDHQEKEYFWSSAEPRWNQKIMDVFDLSSAILNMIFFSNFRCFSHLSLTRVWGSTWRNRKFDDSPPPPENWPSFLWFKLFFLQFFAFAFSILPIFIFSPPPCIQTDNVVHPDVIIFAFFFGEVRLPCGGVFFEAFLELETGAFPQKCGSDRT